MATPGPEHIEPTVPVPSAHFYFYFLCISHIIQLTPQELSAEAKNSASAEALTVASQARQAR